MDFVDYKGLVLVDHHYLVYHHLLDLHFDIDRLLLDDATLEERIPATAGKNIIP